MIIAYANHALHKLSPADWGTPETPPVLYYIYSTLTTASGWTTFQWRRDALKTGQGAKGHGEVGMLSLRTSGQNTLIARSIVLALTLIAHVSYKLIILSEHRF